MGDEGPERAWLEAEERVRTRVEPDGTVWTKVYLGGGDHLRHWLEQCVELAGEANVCTERIDPGALGCFASEGLFRIWVRARSGPGPGEPGGAGPGGRGG